jgi:hypothetical protein
MVETKGSQHLGIETMNPLKVLENYSTKITLIIKEYLS